LTNDNKDSLWLSVDSQTTGNKQRFNGCFVPQPIFCSTNNRQQTRIQTTVWRVVQQTTSKSQCLYSSFLLNCCLLDDYANICFRHMSFVNIDTVESVVNFFLYIVARRSMHSEFLLCCQLLVECTRAILQCHVYHWMITIGFALFGHFPVMDSAIAHLESCPYGTTTHPLLII
jgi:hypothetical protein